MTKQELIGFIEEQLVGDQDGVVVTEQMNLIEEGIVDSMGLMSILTFLEDRTGLRIPDGEVGPDNFATVEAITRLVDRLRLRSG